MNSNAFEYLNERGYVYQATHEEQINAAVNGEPITFCLRIE